MIYLEYEVPILICIIISIAEVLTASYINQSKSQSNFNSIYKLSLKENIAT